MWRGAGADSGRGTKRTCPSSAPRRNRRQRRKVARFVGNELNQAVRDRMASDLGDIYGRIPTS